MATEGDVRAGGAFVELGVDGFESIRSGLQSVQSELQSFGKKLAIGLGAVTGLFGVAIRDAADFEEVNSKFETVFKDNAEAAREWAKGFGDAAGVSQLALLEMLSTFQDTFVPLGFARDEAAKLSTQLSELAIDLGSFNNKNPKESADALTSALVGNHEAVRGLGIIMTQASLDAELLAMGFSGGAKSATEQQKVMARLGIIMKSTSDAQGDAIKTSDSWQNTMKAIQAELENISVTIGKLVIPELTQFVQLVRDSLKALRAWIEINPEVVHGLFQLTKSLYAVAGATLGVVGAFFLLKTVFGPIALVSIAVLSILDAAGIVDTGIRSLAETFRIKGVSIAAYFDATVSEMIVSWYKFQQIFLKGLKFMLDNFQSFASTFLGPFAVILKVADIFTGGLGDDIEKKIEDIQKKIDDQQKVTFQVLDEDIERGIEKAKALAEALKKGLGEGEKNNKKAEQIKLPSTGVTGLFGGQNAFERLGFLKNNTERQQLTQMIGMRRDLREIAKNTRGGNVAEFA